MGVRSGKLICIAILLILTSPQQSRNPVEVGMSSMIMGVGASAERAASTTDDEEFHPPGPALKEWRLDTNFDNVDNWRGLAGHENCSQNIYSFPAWYDEEFVVTLPDRFYGKQIILPVNGHFVFREGNRTFLPIGEDSEEASVCEGREVEFVHEFTADWYDPTNWNHRGQLKDGERSLLNVEKLSGSLYHTPELSSSAIPHVERVPCQYDSVWFRGNSSFNLKISSNVTIAKFFAGDKKLSYTDVAILMSSPLGRLQFQKAPETTFSIMDDDSIRKGSSLEELCSGEQGDSDQCICSNYGNRAMRKKICTLANCNDESEDDCPNPITPHGFCCSICGFHMKIRHSGNLKLIPVYEKLKGEVSREASSVRGAFSVYLTRYKEKGAHVVILPKSRHFANLTTRTKLRRLTSRIETVLKQEREVIEVTLTESWGRAAGEGESSDRLEGSGLGGGFITLIVFLVLVVILGGIALFIFIWNRKHGYPPMTLSSMTSALPRMSSMRIPIVSGGGASGGGRRSSTLSSSLQSFGFARFTNERMSSVTISPGESSTVEGSGGSTLVKSSSLRRADKVDDGPLPMMAEEKVTDANSGAFGFSQVTYDLVAGVEEAKEIQEEEKKEEKKQEHPHLTIPEVTVVDMADESPTSELVPAPTAPPTTPETTPKEGKAGKPGFMASMLAKSYQKLGAAPEQTEKSGGVGVGATKKGKKGKKSEGTFKSKRLEEEDSDDDNAAKDATNIVAITSPSTEQEQAVEASHAQITGAAGITQENRPPQGPTEGELVNLEE